MTIDGGGGPMRLDALLGDADDPQNPFGYPRIAELDEREEFPAAMCAALDRAGFPALYVPAAHGGLLRRFDRVTAAVRTLAARDLTVAIAHAKTFLGAASVWVAGDPVQARELGADICAGSVVSWGLTEPGHGSDLLAGEVTAAAGPDGYRVNGTKWLINNGTRSDLVCALVRTETRGGPRGFSLLLIDKRRLAPGSVAYPPKVRTHGIRGADISGVSFRDAVVPAQALVGAPGDGISLVLRALQVTRTACAALSLGAADHALRLAGDFADGRLLYGRRLGELPYARRRLGECYARLVVAEAVSVLADRSVHVVPEQLSVVSAVSKSLVPPLVGAVIGGCGELLGARAFLTDTYRSGMFQKLERDHRIVPIFDGSTHAAEHALTAQFGRLGRAYRDRRAAEDTLDVLAGMHRELPELDLSRLELTSRDGCGVVQALPAAAADLLRRARWDRAVRDDVEALVRFSDGLHAELARYRPRRGMPPAAAFRWARGYGLAYAASAVLQLWLHNGRAGPLWERGAWLAAALRYLRCRAERTPLTGDCFDALADAAAELRREGAAVTIAEDPLVRVPCPQP